MKAYLTGIGGRLTALAALAIVAFAVMGTVLYQTRARLAELDARAQQETQLRWLSGRIDRHMVSLQMTTRRFVARPRAELVNAYETGFDAIRAPLDTIRSVASDNGMRRHVARLGKGVAHHKEVFEDLVRTQKRLGYGPADGLRGRINEAANTVDKNLDKMIAGALGNTKNQLVSLSRTLMSIRMATTEYIARRDATSLDVAAEHRARFEDKLEKASLFDTKKQQLRDLVSEYFEALGAFREAAKRVGGLRDQAATDLAKLRAPIDALTANAAAKRSAARTAADAARRKANTVFAATLALGVAVMVLGTWAIGRSITVPIRRMTHAMTRLAEGDVQREVPHRDRKDEVGDMAKALSVFKAKTEEVLALKEETERKEAEAAAQRREARHEMASSFEHASGEAIADLHAASRDLTPTAESMAELAEDTRCKTENAVAAMQQTSRNVETVASASEQLTGSIQDVTRQVSEAAETARAADGEARTANQQVQALSGAADDIGEVVQQIQDIAEQTNLLALNATIEAARAGEAGKGFAVVANEVKNLASQTQKATETISGRIERVQSETRDAVAAIERIAGSVGRIDSAASAIAAAMEQQDASTREIARNISEASQGARHAGETIAHVNDAATRTGEAATSVLANARQLDSTADALNTRVREFLDSLRAA